MPLQTSLLAHTDTALTVSVNHTGFWPLEDPCLRISSNMFYGFTHTSLFITFNYINVTLNGTGA